MDSEKKDGSKDFGKVIDILHNKAKLSSLRTYQGDVAEFIKEKNESVISVVVKEKTRENKKEEEREKTEPKLKLSHGNFQINFTRFILSIVLITGGVTAFFYIFEYVNRAPTVKVPLDTEIIPYNNIVTLVNVTNKNLGLELAKLVTPNGVILIKISDSDGHLLINSQNFFNFLDISGTITIRRTLKDDFAVGVIATDNQKSNFLIIGVNDFGQAFSSMLDWEGNMAKDLVFLNTETNAATSSTTALTASATPSMSSRQTIPLKPDIFVWKDLIIKNKDTRGLVNQKNQAKIAYTFLDKNTILITNNLSAIGDIASIYASRFVAR